MCVIGICVREWRNNVYMPNMRNICFFFNEIIQRNVLTYKSCLFLCLSKGNMNESITNINNRISICSAFFVCLCCWHIRMFSRRGAAFSGWHRVIRFGDTHNMYQPANSRLYPFCEGAMWFHFPKHVRAM